MVKSKCSKDSLRKLSLMQKIILKFLVETEGGGCYISELSWFIARMFNSEHGDRIWDATEQKKQLLEEFQKNRSKESYELTMATFRVIDIFHRKREMLTEKHRASFSRSLRRLDTRGLVERRGGWRANYVKLTEFGCEVAEVVDKTWGWGSRYRKATGTQNG